MLYFDEACEAWSEHILAFIEHSNVGYYTNYLPDDYWYASIIC